MPTAPRDHVQFLFRAYADPVRLRLLHALRGGELCVCDLMAIVDLPQATVSRHLSYLRRAGLLDCRRAGAWSYYTLTTPVTRLHRLLVQCLDACGADVPELRADRVRAARLRRQKGRC